MPTGIAAGRSLGLGNLSLRYQTEDPPDEDAR